MQPVLELGSIDKPLTFDVGLIQLSSYQSVRLYNTYATFQSNCTEGLHFCAFRNFGDSSLIPRAVKSLCICERSPGFRHFRRIFPELPLRHLDLLLLHGIFTTLYFRSLALSLADLAHLTLHGAS